MAERRSALGGAASGARVRFSELSGRRLVQISAFHGRIEPARASLERAAGLPPPRVVGETTGDRERRILCVGPGRWWVIGVDPEGLRLDPTACAVVDQSHGRTVIEIRGAGARQLLAKGCALDLHAASFPPGACAATALAQVAVILDARDRDRFEVHAPRSYARSLLEWLDDAGLEFEADPAP